MENVFESLKGKTLSAVEISDDRDEMTLTTTCGERYRMYHSKDCCETVKIEDICGDIEDVIGTPLLAVEEATSVRDPVGYKDDGDREAFLWTFYKMATINGYLTIRWLGESNGYHGMGVECERVR